MVQPSEIQDYARRLGSEFRPRRVILFGSHAYGRPTEDSDVDVLVEMDHAKPKDGDQAIEIDLRLERSFPLDLIVRRPDEIRRRVALGDPFLKTVLDEGQVLYERPG